ncbi:MAG: NAD-dependent dihydropyrimidine dehydrogenase subunit PreA [Elusimicrobia bacterium]|nr:NAD-dependent dihydropyrimidine dehydrogenase subunit PreA [Elusimicrobiota bacterium]
MKKSGKFSVTRDSSSIDLSANCAGIKSPNPFWLASAPPTNSGEQVMRAFDCGWGGAVWKTLGQDPPVINTTSRYGALEINGMKMAGFNNVELITDRSLKDNLREIYEVKKRYPKNAVVASLMVPCERQAWHDIVQQVEESGCDGLELNFGCPHGMSERGMGSAVGQVPEYIEQVVGYVKEVAKTPVLVKLTPNITDIRYPARAAKRGKGDGISLINTINSIMGIDLETLKPKFSIQGKIAHGGYCGPAVKPIALNMISQIATDPETKGLPLSGIGGVSNWADAVEFMLLGASSVQVCTAVMHYGFRIVEEMIDGLTQWMRGKSFTQLSDFVGLSSFSVVDWKKLNLHAKTVAKIDSEKCIQCDLCYIACNDTAHQCIALDPSPNLGVKTPKLAKQFGEGQVGTLSRIPHVIEEDCVGCNLCSIVCPVENCITMEEVQTGLPALSWEEYVAKGMKGYREVYKRFHD